jgi:hypothetical protein
MHTSGPSEVIQLLSAPAVSMICSVRGVRSVSLGTTKKTAADPKFPL